MKKHLDLLESAIAKIDEKYYLRGERDFTYELYHQLRLIDIVQTSEFTFDTEKKVVRLNLHLKPVRKKQLRQTLLLITSYFKRIYLIIELFRKNILYRT